MADHQLTCAGCGVQFSYHRKKKYCTRQCGGRAREATKRRRLGVPARADARPAVVHTDHACKLCGKVFRPKASDRTKFCGRECGLAWTGALHMARSNGARVSFTVLRLNCMECGARFSAANGRQKRCGACISGKPKKYYQPVKGRSRSCAECGQEFIAMGGGEFSSLKFCSKACKNADQRKRPNYRELQKAAKARRRARKKGAAVCERVSPTRVFERDGWRCQICGRKTLKGKRGTPHPRAPELDHIVALANGGDHSYRNTQCACRSCNGAKGASDYGQIPLFAHH